MTRDLSLLGKPKCHGNHLIEELLIRMLLRKIFGTHTLVSLNAHFHVVFCQALMYLIKPTKPYQLFFYLSFCTEQKQSEYEC